MKLEMRTYWLPVINPGLYGTKLGNTYNEVAEEYTEDFRKQLCLEFESLMNKLFSEYWFVKLFGNVTVSNCVLNSPKYYNYENDFIEFDMEIEHPELILEYWETLDIWDKHKFFKWTNENYGNRPGFVSNFPYAINDFEYALYTMKGDYDYNQAVAMLIRYAIEESNCATDSYQEDLEGLMEEYCTENALYEWMQDVEIVDDDEDDYENHTIICQCPKCKREFEFELTQEEYKMYFEYQYLGLHHIQDVFPNRTPGERELLMGSRGMCGDCWKKLFGSPEEEAWEDDDDYNDWDDESLND